MPTLPPASPLALAIVSTGTSALTPGAGAWPFGKLWSFSEDEHDKLETVYGRITNYLRLVNPKRPLCIAVFGPPGSGKSRGVVEIVEQLKDRKDTDPKNPEPKPELTELNLTQFGSTQELAKAVAVAANGARRRGFVPFIFFDEFDAALNGSPLGWLAWFLAPMQDGAFIRDGVDAALAKAVYIFAGGTAAKMEEFGTRDPDGFRLAKGPDFVSRLHSFIDVLGPNDRTEPELRRSVALWFALEAARKQIGRPLALDEDFLPYLIRAGRYRHGQRSVEAVVAMMAERANSGDKLGHKALPADFLLAMHVDRGPFDPETIGGLIGLSSGDVLSGKAQADRHDLWVNLAGELWALGATIAYAGNWNPDGLTQALINVALPNRLRRDAGEEPGLEVHARTPPPTADSRVTSVLVAPPALPDQPEAVRQAALDFRMRWQSGVRCRARILLSGKIEKYSGRMPGIIEEAMIAIALRQPIYVLGGFGGAAAALGERLGLATATPAATELKLSPGMKLDALAHIFRPTSFEGLPLTTEEALSYIASNPIGSPGWTSNGLTVEENRTLFALNGAEQEDRRKAIELIRRGLLRRFDR
jgi:hypothetical protein